MIGEEKGSVAISGRSSHKMTGLITAIVRATRKRRDRAKSTTRLSLRVSLYAEMLTSEI